MYTIKTYQRGFENEQVRIGIEVARDWIWPYAYNLEGLLRLHNQPDFDPDTRQYCFYGDDMVGYMFSDIFPLKDGGGLRAYLDFPRLLPGHEQAAELLLEKAIDMLKAKGVSRIEARVTTMCPANITLAEKLGFSITDWGHKVYYNYNMSWGQISVPNDVVKNIESEKDFEECAAVAEKWYKRSPEWCLSHLKEWHKEGIICHIGIRQKGKIIASCLAARNDVRPSTAAIFYIYTPNDIFLKPILVRVIKRCIDERVNNLIADLINEHRQYEPLYQSMGFIKVAEWARCLLG